MLSGDNGIIAKAVKAKKVTEKGKNIEIEEMDDVDNRIEEFINSYNEIKGCNNPKLTVGMVPVNYDEENNKWEKCSIDDWDWDYIDQGENTTDGSEGNKGTSKWANAMTEDGSLWVWIPRYAYKIGSEEDKCYHKRTAGIIDIVFLVGGTNRDKDGNKYSTSYDIKTTTTNGYMQDFIIHPAFGKELEQGGWSYNTTGFWVSKFEAGYAGTENATADLESIDYTKVQNSMVKYTSNKGSNLTTEYGNIYGNIEPNETLMKYPIFSPNVFSYVNISVGDAFGLSQSLNTEDNPYGLSKNCDTHMLKNSEWGAIAYLTHSKYGRNGTEVSVNNAITFSGPISRNTRFYIKTGFSSGTDTSANYVSNSENIYNTDLGVLASSTGNIYGVYDLSGGASEFVASYSPDLNIGAIDSSRGSAQPYFDECGSYLFSESNKIYKEIHSRNIKQVARSYAYPTHNNIFGDAIWEISSIGNSSGYAWNGDDSRYPAYNTAFTSRGR